MEPGGDTGDAADRRWFVLLSSLSDKTAEVAEERTKVTKAIESSLQKTVMKIITIVNRDKDHIPPITTTETNPFPYKIDINPREEGWGKGMRMF